MKKLLAFALLFPFVAFGQTFPSPTFNSLTLQTPLTAANGGTGVTSSTGSGSLVLNTSPSIATPTITGSFTATGLVTPADHAAQAANTLLANATGSSASPTAIAVPSCSTTDSLLNWTSGTGLGCSTNYIPNQPQTNHIWVGNGAVIDRLNDRVFMGAATVSDGAFPNVTKDWLTTIQTPTFGSSAPIITSQVAILNNTQAGGALTTGAQTLTATAASATAIGMQSYGYANNNAGFAAETWAYYGEAHRMQATDGNAYGMEITINNQTGATILQTPYSGPAGLTSGIQIDAGNGFSATQEPGQSSPSSALTIDQNTSDNSAPFLKGIIFQNNSILATSSLSEAISFPQNYFITWYGPSNTQTSSIVATGTTHANGQQLNFQEGQLIVNQNNNGLPIAQFVNTASGVNYLSFQGAVTGGNPSVNVGGTDTNAGLTLAAKGTGQVTTGASPFTAPGNDALTYANTGSLSIPTATNTTMTAWTKVFDRLNANFNASTGVFTAPVTGFYQVSASINYNSSTSASVNNSYEVIVVANGANICAGNDYAQITATDLHSANASCLASLTAGQTVIIQAFQNSGSTVTTTASAALNYLSINRVP